MISLLVAYTKNKRVIGAQGKIPWKLSSERNRFKKLCTGKYVIMGRKSFDEIGKPLSYCTLVVVSKSIVAPSTGSGTTACSGTTMVVRQESMGAPQNDAGSLSLSKGIKICPSLEAAINFCKACGQDEILVAGGESIYRQALPFATRIYATEIEADFDGDRFFPELDDSWTSTIESEHEENEIVYKYITLCRQDIISQKVDLL